jgi:putative transposase
MAKKKRHSTEQILAKLKQAELLARQGLGQAEIARDLGISVMTLHRWRKSERLSLRGSALFSETHERPQAEAGGITKETAAIADLLEENSRLRRLVTDILLEKMRIEEIAA